MLVAGTGWHFLGHPRVQKAPDIQVTTVEGKHIRLSSLKGRPVLVNFWSTTCVACIREMPQLTGLYREFAPRGLEVIGIAMAYDPPNRVLDLRRARNIAYPLALDIGSDAARAFGDVRLTPTTFLIAPDGHISLHTSGELDMQKVRRLIAGMLEPSAATANMSARN
jgi:peroxiredoxin